MLEWFPEEWPDGVPSVKQLLVVALLLIAILLLFAAELTLFVRTSALLIGEPIPFERETPQVKCPLVGGKPCYRQLSKIRTTFFTMSFGWGAQMFLDVYI